MSSISSVSSYYQLSSLLSGVSGSTSSGTGSSTGNIGTSLVQTLAQALNGVSSGSGSSGSGSSDAYLLDLSPSAQSLLSGGSSGSGSSSTTFTLSSAQQSKIQSILAQYKDAPFDQATFNSIQNALEAAGLGPDQLAAQNQISSFNPTNILVSALSGNYASLNTPSTTASSESTKASNYMESILSDWKSISTTASGSSSASGASSAASTTLS